VYVYVLIADCFFLLLTGCLATSTLYTNVSVFLKKIKRKQTSRIKCLTSKVVLMNSYMKAVFSIIERESIWYDRLDRSFLIRLLEKNETCNLQYFEARISQRISSANASIGTCTTSTWIRYFRESVIVSMKSNTSYSYLISQITNDTKNDKKGEK
jgi:hypothetical protein